MAKQQQQLFETTEPDPWLQDDQAQVRVASVVFAEPPFGPFDYEVPDPLRDQLQAGMRVRVPLGRSNRGMLGYCVSLTDNPQLGRKLKPIRSVVDKTRLLSPGMLRLTEWIAEEYLCELGQVLEGVIPAGVRTQAGTREKAFLSVPTSVAARITQLKLPPKQAHALRTLNASTTPMTAVQLAAAAGCTEGPVKGLIKKKLVNVQRERVHEFEGNDLPTEQAPNLELNDAQERALAVMTEALQAGEHQSILVHGVTGSGKTEVYIRAIEQVVSFGRQAIVLVPEISLTPQTQRRFRSRFSEVAVLHSHLSAQERNWHWQRIARGEVQVIVGARSAVFAPAPHLGLIILDEEHDASFKQDSVPRYHARDVALRRAQQEQIPLVLGSATPSLESWFRTRQTDATLVEMPDRVSNLPLPAVTVVDQRLERGPGQRGAITRPLLASMEQALQDGGKVILLLNRRGYATNIQCPACGTVVQCPECEIPLTHHRDEDVALCHYCEYQIAAPSRCPECRGGEIRYAGLGTQRLESQVQALFPNESCLRMDSDTMRRPGSHEEAFTAFRRGDARILVGTQMIAKGLDFPDVTLVGVINADTALHFPDFRAAERTFQLVTQVAGRTGRGPMGGRVIVQTFSPDHPAILAAQQHDFLQFAEQELPLRQQFGFPPLNAVIRVIVRSESVTQAEQCASEIAKRLREIMDQHDNTRILGPAPAPFAKLRGRHRFHVLASGPDKVVLRNAFRSVQQNLQVPDSVQYVVDVDPLDML